MSRALAVLLLAALSSTGRAGPVEELFTKNCVPCHGKDGRGNTPAGKKVGAKDLTVSKTSPAEIEKQIKEGKLDPKGTAKMPAFGGKISEDEIKSLVDYVLHFRKAKQP